MKIAEPQQKLSAEKEYRQVIECNFHGRIVGFPDFNVFRLITDSRFFPFIKLESTELPEVKFTLIDPWTILEDYTVKIPDADLEKLKTNDSNDLLILSVVTLHKGKASISVNLAAPLIINLREKTGIQLILEDETLPINYVVNLA